MMMTMVTMEEMFARCCPCTASVAMVTTMTTMMMIMVKMEEEKMLICRNLSFQCFSGYCDNNDDDVVNLYLPFSATWL